tara:strand:+ start:39 stop:641 length:603 start_codon:yes stop_codon:yes gene_type:complete
MAEVQEGLLDKVSSAVRTGKIGQEVRRSARWFHDKVRGLKGELRNRFSSTNAAKFYRESEKINPLVFRKRVSLGDLFCYYYNPKYRDVLPYYDMFPMIMLIGADKDTFLGINFHYLAPKFRAILLDRVTAKVGKGIINWKKISKIREIAPTIKRYRFDHIMKKVVPIEESEQEVAIFLPTERFKKSSRAQVWSDSKRRFG